MSVVTQQVANQGFKPRQSGTKVRIIYRNNIMLPFFVFLLITNRSGQIKHFASN